MNTPHWNRWNVLIDGLALQAPLGGAARYAQETWPRLAQACQQRGGRLHVLLPHRGDEAIREWLPRDEDSYRVHYATPSLLTRQDRWIHGTPVVHKILDEARGAGQPISLIQTQTAVPLRELGDHAVARVHLCHGLRAQLRDKWFARTVARLGLRKVLSHSDAVLAVSQDLSKRLTSLHSSRSFVASPGSDHAYTRIHSRPAPPRPDPSPNLFWLGPAAPHKGLRTLLLALAGLEASTRIELRVAEGELEPYRAEMAPVQQQVVRTEPSGRLDSSDVLLGARVMVLPSELESFGMVLLEGLATGMPLVVSDLPAHREVVGPAHPHIAWFPPGDVEACRRALQSALQSNPSDGRSERMQRARQFTWDQTVSTILEAWGHALSLRGLT